MSHFRWRPRISASMVVAFIALAVALGGTSYAATKIAARSVGSKEIKRNGVARVNIASNAVNAAKVASNSLTGADINEASLDSVPRAAAATTAAGADRATTAGAADRAGVAAGLDRVIYRVAAASIPPAPDDPGDPDPSVGIPVHATATAACPAGHLVVGGGANVDDTDVVGVEQSFPDQGGRAWTAGAASDDATAAHAFNVYAICLPAGAAG